MPVVGNTFGLDFVYEKQVENVDNNNFESWPESATYGYFVGGITYPGIVVNTISRLDFSNETTSNPGKGFPSEIQQQASISSNSYGYFGGGRVPPTVSLNYSSTITRLDFSNETLSLPGNNLPTAVTSASATESNSYGYFGGGYFNPGIYYNTITRLDFSIETISLPGKNLPFGRSSLAATSSNTYGYFGGGFSPPTINTISRIDFLNETVSDPGNNLPSGRYGLAATSNNSYGYFGGGFSGSNINTISRLDFSNETTSNPGKNISTPKVYIAATSSNTYGYFGGGYFPTLVDTISRLDFSTENVSEPSSGGLDSVRKNLSAVSGGASLYRGKGFKTYGYLMGSSASESTIRRFSFSDETVSTPGNNLLTNLSHHSRALYTNNYAYTYGGLLAAPNTYTSNISRLDFSNETVNDPGANYPANRTGQQGVSHNSYGYIAAGYTFNPPSMYYSTQMRLDFSNETIKSLTNYPYNIAFMGSVESNSYGYFAGGLQGPTTRSTINRLDFSTDTLNSPNLPLYGTARYSMGSGQNNSYGYFFGGNSNPTIALSSNISRLDFSTDNVSTPGNYPSTIANTCNVYNSYYTWSFGGISPSLISSSYRFDFSSDNINSISNFPTDIARSCVVSN